MHVLVHTVAYMSQTFQKTSSDLSPSVFELCLNLKFQFMHRKNEASVVNPWFVYVWQHSHDILLDSARYCLIRLDTADIVLDASRYARTETSKTIVEIRLRTVLYTECMAHLYEFFLALLHTHTHCKS